MANVLYPKFKEHLLKADVDFDTATIKAALVDTGTYTYSAAHEFYSSVSGVVGTPGAITNPTMTNGVFDGDDVTFTSVSGASVEAIILYNDTGVAATSHLIAYFDTATGLPVTPNGGNIVIAWDAGANKIFAL
jgi:hypothetical protein